MKLSRLAGCVAASGALSSGPLDEVGAMSAVGRAVATLRQAGAFPVVVVLDADDEETRYHLSNQGVVFLRHDRRGPRELFDLVRLGFTFLQGKCEKIAFAPVSFPLFSPETVQALAARSSRAVVPGCRGALGHPVVVAEEAVPDILAYDGPGGLAGALRSLGEGREVVEVDDGGVLASVRGSRALDTGLDGQALPAVRAEVHLSLEREATFCDERTKLLLYLLDDTASMRRACEMMGLSYAKGRDLVDRLERVLGYRVAERRRGGPGGGTTHLTGRGREFLRAYQELEERTRAFAAQGFREAFGDGAVSPRGLKG